MSRRGELIRQFSNSATAWRLDGDRLAAVTAAVAPGIPIIDQVRPDLGLDGPDRAGSVAKTVPAD